MSQVVLISGAGTGFGALTARKPAKQGRVVYAGMRNVAAGSDGAVGELQSLLKRPEQPRARRDRRCVCRYFYPKNLFRAGEIGCVRFKSTQSTCMFSKYIFWPLPSIVHNAGAMSYGPTEAFTPAHLARLYDVNVLGTQRINRAALPHMRKAGKGLLCWVSSSSAWLLSYVLCSILRRKGWYGLSGSRVSCGAEPMGYRHYVCVAECIAHVKLSPGNPA